MKSFHDCLCGLYDRFKTSSIYNGFQWFVHGDMEARILRMVQYSQFVSAQHQKIFPQFKNKYFGRKVVVVACGPSASKYQPIKDAVHISVNRAIFMADILFDYLFINDGGAAFTREEMDHLNAYRGDDCVKFYGYQSDDMPLVSESDVIKAHAYRFANDNFFKTVRECQTRFPVDLSTQPLATPVSTVFAALQFALWTNPQELYLVGCDCSQDGHFYDPRSNTDLPVGDLIRVYHKFAEFAKRVYPDTELISINPVGLKGLFKDVYVG